MGTFTTSLRLSQQTPGDPAVKNAWGANLNNGVIALVDDAVAGIANVNMTGIASHALTTANGSSDEARKQVYEITGTPSGAMTITLPAVSKVGWAWNTTGTQDMTLTTGGGTTLVVPKGTFAPFICDGTNVQTPNIALQGGISIYNAATYESFYTAAGTLTGSITNNGAGGVTYGSVSDYRLKENVAPLENALPRVAALRPVRYTHRDHPGTFHDGFVAHELQEFVPGAVIGNKDAVDDLGREVHQTVDLSRLVPLAIAAIRELAEENASLKERLAVLERGNDVAKEFVALRQEMADAARERKHELERAATTVASAMAEVRAIKGELDQSALAFSDQIGTLSNRIKALESRMATALSAADHMPAIEAEALASHALLTEGLGALSNRVKALEER